MYVHKGTKKIDYHVLFLY